MKVSSLKIIAVFIGFSLSTPYMVSAQEEPTDSVAYAFSSLMAGYMLNDVPAGTEDSESFVQGLNDALSTEKSRFYYYGVLNGFNVMQRIANMSGLGAQIDANNVFPYLSAMLRNRNTGGLTNEEANGILNKWIARSLDMPADTVSTESQAAFIEKLEKEPGAIKYPSGIVVITIADNQEGICPTEGQTAMVTYEGRLSDGKVFDSTDEPIALPLSNLIKGFAEGLTKMRTGGTYRLIIPAAQAYGDKGIPGAIPGNAALDFTLTIHEVK